MMHSSMGACHNRLFSFAGQQPPATGQRPPTATTAVPSRRQNWYSQCDCARSPLYHLHFCSFMRSHVGSRLRAPTWFEPCSTASRSISLLLRHPWIYILPAAAPRRHALRSCVGRLGFVIRQDSANGSSAPVVVAQRSDSMA